MVTRTQEEIQGHFLRSQAGGIIGQRRPPLSGTAADRPVMSMVGNICRRPLKFPLQLHQISGWDHRTAVLIGSLVHQIQSLRYGTQQQTEQQALLVKSIQLARHLVTQVARQDVAGGIGEKRVLLNRPRKDLLVEVEDEQRTKGNAAGIHGIEDLNATRTPIVHRYAAALEYVNHLGIPLKIGNGFTEQLQCRDRLKTTLDFRLHALLARLARVLGGQIEPFRKQIQKGLCVLVPSGEVWNTGQVCMELADQHR